MTTDARFRNARADVRRLVIHSAQPRAGRIERARQPDAADPSCNRIVAAIDIGSTSAHLLVAGWTWQMIVPLLDESVDLGLGRHVDRDGQLGPRRRARVVRTVSRFVGLARRRGADTISIVGTEPMRHATDASELTIEIQMATGVRMAILDHSTEGRLGLLGVTRGATLTEAVGVLDIGGGSTEVTVSRPGEPASVNALRVGALRLTEAVEPSNPPSWADVVAMRTVAREFVREMPRLPDVAFTAVGGTARALLRLATARTRPGALGRDDLERITGQLVQQPRERVASRHGLRAERARLLPAGTAILFALMEQLDVETVEVSLGGLREGLVAALVQTGPGWHEALIGAGAARAEAR